MEKIDTIQYSVAYFSCYFFTMWFIWGYEKYGVIGCKLFEFLFECVNQGISLLL